MKKLLCITCILFATPTLWSMQNEKTVQKDQEKQSKVSSEANSNCLEQQKLPLIKKNANGPKRPPSTGLERCLLQGFVTFWLFMPLMVTIFVKIANAYKEGKNV